MITSFTFSRVPVIYFGAGKFGLLGEIISRFGRKALVVTGERSFVTSGGKEALGQILDEKSITPVFVSVSGEPSPEFIDTVVSRYRDYGIDTVCAVGGGSVIDAGKAISAMLPHDDSVFEYLEGVGTGKMHDGVKVSLIAVPTTAGTGSEATKNAVLSRVGRDGFKKSLRHDNFVPDVAVIDPELALSCPPSVTAASGMDAFCQLLESYVSPQATPMTDALAISGLSHVSENLVPACTTGAQNPGVRAGMAYGALLSGITLANAGLGVVHGLASVLGGLFPIPHGTICGTLVRAATEATIEQLKKGKGSAVDALEKYARVGALVSDSDCVDRERCCCQLVEKLHEWTEVLKLPLLGEFGVTRSDIDLIIERTENKNNPAQLERDVIRRVIESRI